LGQTDASNLTAEKKTVGHTNSKFEMNSRESRVGVGGNLHCVEEACVARHSQLNLSVDVAGWVGAPLRP
jgi:hypothetical protein